MPACGSEERYEKAAPTAKSGMIRNLTRDTIIARQPRIARSLAWRLRGMIARDFAAFDALLFPACNAIHTWGMRIPLDVLFLDADDRVCALRTDLRPWRVAGARRARRVVELPTGAIGRSSTQVGDAVEIGDPD